MTACVRGSRTLLVRDVECNVYTWNVDENVRPKALVIVYHGFGAHGDYPTVRYACERLCSSGYALFAPDMPGHGQSGGLKGYLPSVETMIDDGVAFYQDARKIYKENIKVFLVGSSMGGTISLSVAQRLGDAISGVVLLAPMLKLNVDTISRYLLGGLSMIIPTFAIIPSNSTSSEKQYRDPVKRKECDDDQQVLTGYLRVGSASTCVEMASSIQSKLSSITVPFLAMVADEDEVVDSQGALDLMDQAKSDDKTIKHYAALHGLLCEPSPLVDQIQDDMVEWMDARV